MFHGSGIRAYIQSHKNDDTEFWYSANGDYYILSLLMRYTKNDWKSLISNIPNWDVEEIEILILSTSNLGSYDHEFDEISVERSRLFTTCYSLLPQTNQSDYLDELSEILDLPHWDKSSLLQIRQKLNDLQEHSSDDVNLEEAISLIKIKIEGMLKVGE